MSRTAAALLLLVAQIASTNAQEECVGEDSVPGVSLEWDDASVTVNNLGGFGSDGDTNAAQMLKFEDVNYKNGEPQNYFGPTTQVDLEIKTAAFKLELPIHPMSRRANDGETLTAEWAYKPKLASKNGKSGDGDGAFGQINMENPSTTDHHLKAAFFQYCFKLDDADATPADMVKFAFSFYDFDNDSRRRAQECLYVPEKAFCTQDENGECANNEGCKSGDTLGNLANGCAVGRNGKYKGDEMIAIDRFEDVDWPTADNERFGKDGVWTDNGATEPTNVIRICAINIGSGCDNPFSTGGAYGLCHQQGGPPGMNCPGYECDTKQLEAKSVNLNMNRAQTGCFVIANSVGSPTEDFDCKFADGTNGCTKSDGCYAGRPCPGEYCEEEGGSYEDGDPIETGFPNADDTTTNKKCPKGSSISPGGRNFNFAGQADLIDPCPSPAPPPPPPPSSPPPPPPKPPPPAGVETCWGDLHLRSCVIPEWSRGGSVQEALGQETSGLIKLPQEHYRDHLKKFFHAWRNEIEAQMGECSAADRDAFGQVQRTQWSIQNKCLSQPQESCPNHSPFDLERAACACSGRTLDPKSKELKWMDGSLMPLCCAALLKEGELCDECCEAPLAAMWSDDPSDLSVTDRFDGNFNEQDLCEKILLTEIEEAGGHDPDDVAEHLMAFSHAGEYLAHAITFGEDKLTASVPPRNHGSVKAFCNEFGRDMRNYCAAYDFTMTDSKEFKEQAKCMQNSLGKHKVGLHGFVHCHEDTLIRDRDYPFVDLKPRGGHGEADPDDRTVAGDEFADWYDPKPEEGRFANWAIEGQATLNTGMGYVDPSPEVRDYRREVHWDTWRNEAEGDSNSGSWMMLFQEKLTTGCDDAYDGAALSMSYGGRKSTIDSNLNGKGPDTGAARGILFKHVGKDPDTGKDLDLWVDHIDSGSSEDFTANTARNTNCVKDKSDRCVDGFAEINIRGNTRAKLTFSFRNSDNFNQAVTLKKFAFTFYDLDKSKTATEYICIDDSQAKKIEVDESKIDDDTNRAGVQCPSGARDFVAKSYGDVGDNPTSVDSTSRAITMYFEDKSSFDVTLGVMGSSDASRNFRFAPTKPECKEEKVAMCEFGDFGQREEYVDPKSSETVPAKNIYARCLCAKQEQTVADRQAIHPVYAYEYGFADIQRSHQGCPFPTLAEEMAHTFADDELNWLPDECLWNLEAAGACYEPQFKLTKDGVTTDKGVKFPGKELSFPSPSDSGTLDDNELYEYNSYRKGRAVISDCGTPMYLTGGTWSTEWHGFPFCDQDGADGASQFSYCVPDHYCGACKSGHTDCNNACFPEVAAGQDYVPFLGLEDEYLIPNCDCARAEQQEMGSIVMDAAVVDDKIVTDVTDPNCKLCKQDPAPNCHAHPNVYILFVPFFQPLHEESETQKNRRWFYNNAMLWMAADCCQNYYVEDAPDDGDYENKVQHVFMYNSILKYWHATKEGWGGDKGKPAGAWLDSYLFYDDDGSFDSFTYDHDLDDDEEGTPYYIYHYDSMPFPQTPGRRHDNPFGGGGRGFHFRAPENSDGDVRGGHMDGEYLNAQGDPNGLGTVMDWGIPLTPKYMYSSEEYTDGKVLGVTHTKLSDGASPIGAYNFDGKDGSIVQNYHWQAGFHEALGPRGDADGHGYFAYGSGDRDGKQQTEVIAPASLGEQPSGLKTPAPLIGRRLSTLDESGEGWREALSAEQRAALPHGMQLHPPSAAIDLTIGKNAADETAPLVYDVLLEFFFAEGTPKKLAMRVPNSRKADEVKVSLSAVPCARTVRVTSTPCSMSGGKLGCDFEPSVNEQPLPACAEPSDAFLKEKGGTKTAPHFWNTTAAAQAARTQAAAASAAAAARTATATEPSAAAAREELLLERLQRSGSTRRVLLLGALAAFSLSVVVAAAVCVHRRARASRPLLDADSAAEAAALAAVEGAK